jgi:glutamate formiminotransferase/formiminotetrahydrofolate cyclodeaminase
VSAPRGLEIDVRVPSSTLSAEAFNRGIADPNVFSGGGSVAALAAAGAASTALLVMRLNLRRPVNRERAEGIKQSIAETEDAIAALYQAADDDIATLDRLLAAQRELRSGAGHEAYVAALTDAARSPIAMAAVIDRLLQIVEGQLALASRFTVSDLGAAATLADGACRGALITAHVNLVLLREQDGADHEVVDELSARGHELRQTVVTRAGVIERAVLERISGPTRAAST